MNYYYITGTSSGLGKAIAEVALRSGQNTVHGFARNSGIDHKNYIHHTKDLSDPQQTKSVQFLQHNDADKIILINNAGTSGEIRYMGELNADQIISAYHINTITPHILMNAFIDAYKTTPCEKIIINITSGAASNPYDGWSIYCSTKAALDMMTQCAAKEQELRNTGFKIFAIAPGVLNTPMQDHLRETDPHDFSRIDKFIDLKKNNKLADPVQVAEKLIEYVKDPAQLYGAIHRIQL